MKLRIVRNIKCANNSKIFQFFQSNFGLPNWEKFYKFLNFPIWKIPKIFQISQFRRSSKFPLLTNLQNNKISELVQFRKLANFQNLTICKTIKIPKISNLLNYHICILSVKKISTNVKKKENSKIKESNNSTFVILIFEIPKYRPFYIWSFQMLTPTRPFLSDFYSIKKYSKFSLNFTFSSKCMYKASLRRSIQVKIFKNLNFFLPLDEFPYV